MARLSNIASSVKLSAGKRTYFLDLERHCGTGLCLVINESKRLTENGFERHRIVVDQDHLNAFFQSLEKVLQMADRLDRFGVERIGEVAPHKVTGHAEKMPEKGFAAIRKIYPRQYMKWSLTDDENLKDAYGRCKAPRILADTFGRNLGAIQSRLKKLGLID